MARTGAEIKQVSEPLTVLTVTGADACVSISAPKEKIIFPGSVDTYDPDYQDQADKAYRKWQKADREADYTPLWE